MWTNTNKQFYKIFSKIFLINFFVVPKFGTHVILSSDTINFNNLHYVYLCNDFFTGIMESANY